MTLFIQILALWTLVSCSVCSGVVAWRTLADKPRVGLAVAISLLLAVFGFVVVPYYFVRHAILKEKPLS